MVTAPAPSAAAVGTQAGGPWHAPSASHHGSGVARQRSSAQVATAIGLVSPSASACSRRRARAPSRSETRLDSLRWASSSTDSHGFCRRTGSRLNCYFLAVTVRHQRGSASATKLRVHSRDTRRFTRRSAAGKSRLRPGRPRLDSACPQGQRSGLPPGPFWLLAYRLPLPCQRSPPWFPIWGRRFQDYFFGLWLQQPCGQRAQWFGVAAQPPALQLVFAFPFRSQTQLQPASFYGHPFPLPYRT
jgi:hypothetical protein